MGSTLVCMGGLSALPLLVAAIYREDMLPFIAMMLLFFSIGGILLLFKPKVNAFFAKESFFIVSIVWIIVSLIGCLPFIISGYIPNFLDAFFETVSGFTTTGATILKDIEILPKGILFWRSFTHWIGGMGVLVFVMAVLPISKESSLFLARAEMPGPVISKLVPKMHNTAIILYVTYFVLSVILFLLLLLGGMPVFDSLIHTFGTAGTGGFSMMNMSVGAYNSAYFEWVIAIFMLLFGINFNMYFLILLRDIKSVLKNEELRVFFIIIATATLLITVSLAGTGESIGTAIRNAFFQVTSIISTTGYSTANYDLWPTFAKYVLFMLFFCGACAGSTGGGMKISRCVLCAKHIKAYITRSIYPRTVVLPRLNGKIVEPELLANTTLFVIVYVIIMIICGLLISLDGFDMMTSLSASLTAISNVGPGFGGVGPIENYSDLSNLSKIILSAEMLLGRLEIFPMLACLSPLMYKRRRLK